MLVKAESHFDQNKIEVKSTAKGLFDLRFDQSIEMKVEMKKYIIHSYECSCDCKTLCEHIATSFFEIRKRISKKSERKVSKRSTNQTFLNKIEGDELKNFVLSRMKSDKYFKTLLQARFLIEIEGPENFENYIDKAFPPSKTTVVTPAHKEFKLFTEVSEEVYDQIKDLIGRDNYIDALQILIPLIRKSFYFKNRFNSIPEAFLKNHLHLIELLTTLHNIIEAPKLKTANAKKIINLLELSYLSIDYKEEKKLIVQLLDFKENRDLIPKRDIKDSENKVHNQFILTLLYICDPKKEHDKSEIGKIFIELYEWNKWQPNYMFKLLDIAEKHTLPSRFVEKLLQIEMKDEDLLKRQKEICLNCIAKYNSFSLFQWLYSKDHTLWLEAREGVIENLKAKRAYDTLIQILIQEDTAEEIFHNLKEINDIELNFRYLNPCLRFSYDDTFDLYCHWADNYLKIHYGSMANHVIEKELRKVGTVSPKLKGKLEGYILKMYKDRSSLKL